MTWYLRLNPIGQPADAGQDDQGRPVIAFTVNAEKEPSETFLEELSSLLAEKGVAVFGETLFLGSEVTLPEDTDTTPPFLSIWESGGAPPMQTQDRINAYHRPAARVIAHAKDYVTCRALASRAFSALSVRNRFIDAA